MKIKKSVFSHIEFWITVFFVIRLFGITNPPIEVSHNWRQTTGLMVARNFYETNANILYPRLDFAGDKTGITGTEFPLFNYLIYLIALIFGYAHWYGRLIGLIFSSVGSYFFYMLIRDNFDKKTAFYATIILTCSLWFQYSRKTMPDIFSMVLVIAGIYYGLKYLKENKSFINLFLYAFLTLAGLLSKIPSAYILIIFAFYIFSGKVLLKRKIAFILTSIIITLPVIAWYFYWIPYLNITFEFTHYYMGVSLIKGFHEIMNHKMDTLQHFYEHAMCYSGFAVFIMGLILIIKDKNKRILALLGVSTISFVLLLFKMGNNFPKHTYYVLIFIPLMALVAGYGIAALQNKKIAFVLICLVCVENILNQQNDFYIKKERQELMTLEPNLQSISKPTDLIAINCFPNPAAMYLSHRKGWLATNSELKNNNYLNKIYSEGCKYIVVFKKFFGENENLSLPLINETDTYKIYALTKP